MEIQIFKYDNILYICYFYAYLSRTTCVYDEKNLNDEAKNEHIMKKN